jgi:flagellar basal body-associated protein FliL
MFTKSVFTKSSLLVVVVMLLLNGCTGNFMHSDKQSENSEGVNESRETYNLSEECHANTTCPCLRI